MSEKDHIVYKNGEYQTDKVNEAAERMDSGRVDSILSNFEEFKSYLKDRLELGKKLGLSEEQLAVTAQKLGDYLSENKEPQNREEKLLQELWKVGTEEEKHKLAHLLVKLVENGDSRLTL